MGNVLRRMAEEDSDLSYNQSDLCVLFRDVLSWLKASLEF